ncbi:MAG: hypothetical protein CFE32_05650 [Alphaproteobacteria bacterium PA3]|nr:MAG: hypothetical protein CFE32_05650 [Alphaproteobacteria bacterium PA3]
MAASDLSRAAAPCSLAVLSGLPAPVQRSFRATLTDGQRMVSGMTLTQSGPFNLGTTAPRWSPFPRRKASWRRGPALSGRR